ncbi:cytosine permease [Egbenema bharatensis]|uniref:cytosine permease n=1 Tax=Egbenema bharatensis TaxID=3463334 RepID=UPI003A8378EC
MSSLRHWFAEDTASSDEYYSRPVPLHKRLGFKDPALIWTGFAIAYICAVIGGTIQTGLGMPNAIYAILLGNFTLFIYSSLLAYISGKWGLNFPLMVKAVFGAKGAIVPTLILAFLVTGWYAFQTWLTADILRAAFDLQQTAGLVAITILIGIVYAMPTVFGVKSMSKYMQIALPGMIIFALYYLFVKVVPAGSDILSRPGSGEMAFMTGVALTWSTFVVSGTMTGDIVRYTRSGTQAVGVTAVAFLLANSVFMLLGAFISAAINNPEVEYFFDSSSIFVVLPLVIVAFLSNGSTCDACLYNATMGFTNSFRNLTWRSAAVFGMTIGLIAAATGLIGNIVNFLILLGLLVPPIGGAIIADYYFIKQGRYFEPDEGLPFNWAAIVSVIAGVISGYYVNVAYPNFLFGVAGIAVTFAAYLILYSWFGSGSNRQQAVKSERDQETRAATVER